MYIKQWVEIGGIPYPEYGCDEPYLSEEPSVSRVDELLDIPFDSLTSEDWQHLEKVYSEEDEF